VARATVSARQGLEQGFTTIRDLETEGAGYGDVGVKQAVNEGHIPGPRMFVVTRAISTNWWVSAGRLCSRNHSAAWRTNY